MGYKDHTAFCCLHTRYKETLCSQCMWGILHVMTESLSSQEKRKNIILCDDVNQCVSLNGIMPALPFLSNVVRQSYDLQVVYSSLHVTTLDPLVENIEKKQSFSYCGSFDHLDLQSLDDYIFIFLVYQLTFRDFGALNILMERSWKYFFNSVLHAPKI